VDAQPKICLITGANSGIGKAAASGLARQGAKIVMVCRHAKRGEAARSEIVQASGSKTVDLLIADLSSQSAIRRLSEQVHAQYPRLDVLINNAGAMFNRRELTAEGVERTFAVNHLAYFLLSHLLLDRLEAAAPSRIVNVASGAAFDGIIDFDDLMGERGYSRRRAYTQSKLANILFTKVMHFYS
jgi:NAD(P)-dependent dehydrogenase (short-subunit alcohol dehydrogenase family)